MIRINLLPDEIRRRERTPLRRLGALALGVVLAASSLMLLLTVHFGVLQKALSEKEQVASTLATVTPFAQYADSLSREKKDYTKRSDTIQEISNSRVLWTKKLDQFFSVVDYGEKQNRHFIWLKELRVTPPREGVARGNQKNGGSVDLKGFSATEVLHKYSDFHEDVKQSEFFSDFQHIDDPSGKVVSFGDDVQPGKAWEFDLKLLLKSPDERTKEREKTASTKETNAAAPQEKKS